MKPHFLFLLALSFMVAIISASYHPVAHLSETEYPEYCQLAFKTYHAAGLKSGSSHGADISQLHSESVQKCMVNNGLTFMIPRGFRSSGTLDPNVKENLHNAWSASFSHADVYMFPCPTCASGAREQARIQVEGLKGSKYGMVWIDVEGSQYWTGNHAKNIQFFEQLIAALKSYGAVIGIYANHTQWVEIFGDYKGSGGFPVWVPRYNSPANPSCSDLTPFGPYTHFNLKQYVGTTSMCGGSVDLSSYC